MFSFLGLIDPNRLNEKYVQYVLNTGPRGDFRHRGQNSTAHPRQGPSGFSEPTSSMNIGAHTAGGLQPCSDLGPHTS